MTDIIRINPGNQSATIELRASTCLAASTRLDSDAAGMFIARNWPGLSSGEELVWSVIGWLNGQDHMPERATLAATLDKGNYDAVMRVLAAEGISA